MSSTANIWGVVHLIERHILKNGLNNHAAHREILIPQIVSYVPKIPMEHYGMTTLPDKSLIEQHYSSHMSANNGTLPIIWTNVYQCPEDTFVINMFRLYKSSQMPLHDHPQISGINYLLNGQIKHQSYDFIENNDTNNSNKKDLLKVKIHNESEYNEKQSVITLDNNENIHSFEALQDTCIFQILVPNYDHDNKSRPCNYYQFIEKESNDIGYLKKIPNAENYWDISIPFNGSLDGHIYDYSQDE